MVHEFHRLLPVQMLEENKGVIAILPEIEADLCIEPFLRPIDNLPEHASGRIQLKYLHIEAAIRTDAESDHAADRALPFRIGGPPGWSTRWTTLCIFA